MMVIFVFPNGESKFGEYYTGWRVHCFIPDLLLPNTSAYFMWNVPYEGWNFNSGKYLFTTDTK